MAGRRKAKPKPSMKGAGFADILSGIAKVGLPLLNQVLGGSRHRRRK